MAKTKEGLAHRVPFTWPKRKVEKFLQKKRGMHEALAAKMREAEEVKARLRQRAEEVIAGLSHSITDVEGEPAHERPLTRYLEAATA